MYKRQILVLRRPESPYRTVDLALHGLDPAANYELSFDSDGRQIRATGAELMKKFEVTLPEKHSSDLIAYRRAGG